MNRLILNVLLLFSIGSFAQKTPAFVDYYAKVGNKTAKTVNLKSHPKANEFRPNLKNGLAKSQINFGGKYILTQWGCGTACIQAALIDAQTGEVYFPEILQGVIQGYNEAFEKHGMLEFKKNSTLLIIYGAAGNDLKNESEEFIQGTSYYEWSGQEFKLLKFTPIN